MMGLLYTQDIKGNPKEGVLPSGTQSLGGVTDTKTINT